MACMHGSVHCMFLLCSNHYSASALPACPRRRGPRLASWNGRLASSREPRHCPPVLGDAALAAGLLERALAPAEPRHCPPVLGDAAISVLMGKKPGEANWRHVRQARELLGRERSRSPPTASVPDLHTTVKQFWCRGKLTASDSQHVSRSAASSGAKGVGDLASAALFGTNRNTPRDLTRVFLRHCTAPPLRYHNITVWDHAAGEQASEQASLPFLQKLENQTCFGHVSAC